MMFNSLPQTAKVILALILTILILVGLYFWIANQNSTDTSETTKTSQETEGNQATDSAEASKEVEITGQFGMITGDPQDGSAPRYSYSVTDSEGKNTKVVFSTSTEYVGGKTPADFDGETVKVKLKVSEVNEILRIEIL